MKRFIQFNPFQYSANFGMMYKRGWSLGWVKRSVPNKTTPTDGSQCKPQPVHRAQLENKQPPWRTSTILNSSGDPS